MKLDNYILNKNKTLNELLQYGKIDGGGNYSIEYAYGKFIYFSPNSFKFLRTGGFHSSKDTNYQERLENKIKYLIDNNIILESQV